MAKKSKGKKAKKSEAKRRKKEETPTIEKTILFDKGNYMFIIIGLLIVAVGFVLMAGGKQPSPDEWNEEVIYSFRRITLAPIVVLGGLGVVIYAIFKQPVETVATEQEV